MKFEQDQRVTGGLKGADATILNVLEGDVYMLPSYLVKYDDGAAHLLTADYAERNFKAIPKFFQVGRVYTWSGGIWPKYKVTELKELGQKRYAITIVTELDGEQRMSLLSGGTFIDMKEVK